MVTEPLRTMKILFTNKTEQVIRGFHKSIFYLHIDNNAIQKYTTKFIVTKDLTQSKFGVPCKR